ncbi:hypothetical protein IAT40_000309 [Kwoniella sp. CBS 6097]
MNDVDDDVLEDITNMESTFYQEGYRSGFDHGKLHGIFEGRELGNEKSWELWEEIGYYEGWASIWIGQLEAKASGAQEDEKEGKNVRRGKEARALNHAQALLELIASFPTTNPTPASAPAPTSAPNAVSTSDPIAVSVSVSSESSSGRDQTDLASLISQIRAKYKLLCSSLGTRPRLAVAQIIEAKPGSGAANANVNANTSSGIVNGSAPQTGGSGFEGPMKGVDTRQLRF